MEAHGSDQGSDITAPSEPPVLEGNHTVTPVILDPTALVNSHTYFTTKTFSHRHFVHLGAWGSYLLHIRDQNIPATSKARTMLR